MLGERRLLGLLPGLPAADVVINGNVTLMDYCDGSPDYASGGFIADSKFTGAVTNGSQQQYFTRNTDLGRLEQRGLEPGVLR